MSLLPYSLLCGGHRPLDLQLYSRLFRETPLLELCPSTHSYLRDPTATPTPTILLILTNGSLRSDEYRSFGVLWLPLRISSRASSWLYCSMRDANSDLRRSGRVQSGLQDSANETSGCWGRPPRVPSQLRTRPVSPGSGLQVTPTQPSELRADMVTFFMKVQVVVKVGTRRNAYGCAMLQVRGTH